MHLYVSRNVLVAWLALVGAATLVLLTMLLRGCVMEQISAEGYLKGKAVDQFYEERRTPDLTPWH